VWAVLATLGRSGVAALIDRTCLLARRFAAGLAEAGLEVLNDVVLNQVVIGFTSQQQAAAVIGAVQRDGTCWCGPTTWQGRPAMRVSVSGWNTTAADVDASVAAIRACAAAAGATGPATAAGAAGATGAGQADATAAVPAAGQPTTAG